MVGLGIVLGTDVATVVYARHTGLLGMAAIPMTIVTVGALIYTAKALWGKAEPRSDAEQS